MKPLHSDNLENRHKTSIMDAVDRPPTPNIRGISISPSVTSTRISEINLPIFRYLQKLTINLARASHHTEFLMDLTTKGTIPNGLRINIEPHLPTLDQAFIMQWTTIIEETHKKLLTRHNA